MSFLFSRCKRNHHHRELKGQGATMTFNRAAIVSLVMLMTIIAAAETYFVNQVSAAGQPSIGGSMKTALGEITSSNSRTRDRAVDVLLGSRDHVVQRLIKVIDPSKKNSKTYEVRAAAAYTLGQYRAIEAVPALIAMLPESAGRINLDDSRYDDAAFIALVEIGRPAVPVIVELVQNSDDRVLVRMSIDVLYHVLGGKARVLTLLERLKGDDPKKNKRLDWAREYVDGHFKEKSAPLY